MQPELWSYRADAYDVNQSLDIAGYHVEATDGKIGSVDEATYEVGESYIVVDTGPWIFGKKVLLPAGTVTRIDPQERRVHVSRTKEEIKNAPEFDEANFKEPVYRDTVGEYYGRFPYGGTGVY
ncbi:PRC-barrel domain-containing protein [Streptosporangium sp. NPDC000239]|uniref:PRC-barrel domain-containing protein n=1 Tax=unclassified Streptosporangium TaxID=2632669 RepID=UPI00332CB597